jgi:hypothetical protein
MSGTLTTGSGFAAHVHEIVVLDEQGASLGAVEGSIESMSVGVEEQAALRVLASSLHAGANVNQAATLPLRKSGALDERAEHDAVPSKWTWHDDQPEIGP